jgi:hypothetical protein
MDISSQVVPLIPNGRDRSETMDRIVTLINLHVKIPIEMILKHPYRLRHFLYSTKSYEIRNTPITDYDNDDKSSNKNNKDIKNNDNDDSKSTEKDEFEECLTVPNRYKMSILNYLMETKSSPSGSKKESEIGSEMGFEIRSEIRSEKGSKKGSEPGSEMGSGPLLIDEIISWESVTDENIGNTLYFLNFD